MGHAIVCIIPWHIWGWGTPEGMFFGCVKNDNKWMKSEAWHIFIVEMWPVHENAHVGLNIQWIQDESQLVHSHAGAT